jgi:transcriptional regulator GlxA family with amidase domain
MRIALVVYPGVIADECDAFRSVLSELRDTEVVSVGAQAGVCHGQGGVQLVDVEFDDLLDPDIVIVPGGLGTERIAESTELREWLTTVEEEADYIVSSSTGSVVLASAGLLDGAPAATHWLAADLLRSYGSEQADRRLVVSGKIVTCEGRLSAVDAAFTLVRRIEGPAAVVRIRTALIAGGEPHFRTPRWWERFAVRTPVRRTPVRRPATQRTPARRPADSPVTQITPMSVIVELVPAEEIRRRRRGGRRRHQT